LIAGSVAVPGLTAAVVSVGAIARPIEHQLVLEVGDRLVMFTDGLFERRRVDLEIGLTHLTITTEQTGDMLDAAMACESILGGMLAGFDDDGVCLLIADFKD